jgi:uncharacterized protein (TIGR00251 family)
MKIEILVKRTGCNKTEILCEKDNILEMNVKGKPEAGEANLEIVKFFTRKFKSSVEIVKGFKSKRKVLIVDILD